MSSYLQKLKKTELVELAEKADLKNAQSTRKDDLAAELEQVLVANRDVHSRNPIFQAFYSRLSPTKASSTDAEAKTSKPRQRRPTKSATELAADAANEAGNAIARTPKNIQRAAPRVPLPPSPTAVTELVERQTGAITRRISRYWRASGLTPYFEGFRELVSSVVGIATCLIALEAYGLQRVTLPWREAFKLHYVFKRTLGYSIIDAAYFPDFFVLLTSAFWGPTLLWLTTNLAVPAAFGWMFNLTIPAGKRRAYEIDPLVFFLSKAVLSWLVYAEGFHLFGLSNVYTEGVVNLAMPFGWRGIVIGSLVGAFVSLYEAVLRK